MPAVKPSFPRIAHGPAASGLVGGWPVYEGSSKTLYDLSGQGNNGTLIGGVTWTGGQSGWCLLFDGISGKVTVPDNPILSPASIAVGLWVQWTDNSVNSGLIGKRDDGFGTAGWLLEYFPPNLIWIVAVGALVIPFSPTNGIWYHIAARQTGTSAELFINGSSIGTGSASAITNFATPLTIGARSDGFFFKGQLDAPFVYSGILAQPEIAALYADSWRMYRGRGTLPQTRRFNPARAAGSNRVLTGGVC